MHGGRSMSVYKKCTRVIATFISFISLFKKENDAIKEQNRLLILEHQTLKARIKELEAILATSNPTATSILISMPVKILALLCTLTLRSLRSHSDSKPDHAES